MAESDHTKPLGAVPPDERAALVAEIGEAVMARIEALDVAGIERVIWAFQRQVSGLITYRSDQSRSAIEGWMRSKGISAFTGETGDFIEMQKALRFADDAWALDVVGAHWTSFDSNLQTRAARLLFEMRLYLLSDLCAMSYAELARAPGHGKRTLYYVMDQLEAAGFRLGMHPNEFFAAIRAWEGKPND